MLRYRTRIKKSTSEPNILLEMPVPTNTWQKKHEDMYSVADDNSKESKQSDVESEDENGGGIPEEILEKVHNTLSKMSGGVVKFNPMSIFSFD